MMRPRTRPSTVLFSNPPWWDSYRSVTTPDGGERKIWTAGVRAGSRWPHTDEISSCPDDVIFGRYMPYPFFLGGAASWARGKLDGKGVAFRDSIAMGESYDSYFTWLQDHPAEYIVIESATPSWAHDAKLIGEIKEKHPDSKIILTGPITTKAAEILDRYPIHACIKGEYEKGVMRVLNGADGIIDYDLLTVDEMNASPYPWLDFKNAYSYWDIRPAGQEAPQLQLLTSRGCPYKCIFCVWPATMTGNDPDGTAKRTVRQYSADYVEGLIRDAVGRFGYRCVYFDDDTFNLGDRHVLAICQAMARIGLPWSAMCRADTISRDTWRVMRESGCFGVKLGFESGNQTVVDTIINKRLNLEKAREVVFALKDLGMSVHGTFTYGLPGETMEQMHDTKRFIQTLPLDTLQESGTAEIEGTPLATLAEKPLEKYAGASKDAAYQVGSDGTKKMHTVQAAIDDGCRQGNGKGTPFGGTVYYLDPELSGNAGHYANACRHVTGELRRQGIPVEVFGSRFAEYGLMTELGVRRFFSVMTSPAPAGLAKDLHIAAWTAQNLPRDLGRLPPLKPQDLIYVNSVSAYALHPLFQWLYRRFTPDTMPQVVLEFGHDLAIEYGFKTAFRELDLTAALYQQAVQVMPAPYWHRIRLYTFHKRCSAKYAEILGRPVGTLPFPQKPPALPRFRMDKPDLVVGFGGNQGTPKGFQMIPGLARRLLAHGRHPTVLVHSASAYVDPDTMTDLVDMGEADDRMKVYIYPADDKAWWDLLDRMDLLVLPYQPERYRDAYSAILAEAISSGLPVVAPAETSLADLIAEYGHPGVCFDQWTGDSIWAACETALATYDTLAGRAKRAAIRWMTDQGPAGLIDTLLHDGDPAEADPTGALEARVMAETS